MTSQANSSYFNSDPYATSNTHQNTTGLRDNTLDSSTNKRLSLTQDKAEVVQKRTFHELNSTPEYSPSKRARKDPLDTSSVRRMEEDPYQINFHRSTYPQTISTSQPQNRTSGSNYPYLQSERADQLLSQISRSLRSLTMTLKEGLNANLRSLSVNIDCIFKEFEKLTANAINDFEIDSQQEFAYLGSFIIYNCGILIDKSTVNLPFGPIKYLLLRLVVQKNITPKQIGHLFYGLGKMCKAKKLDGLIDAKIIVFFIKTLEKSTTLDPLAISNFIWAVGLMALEGRIEGFIEATTLNDLIKRLLFANILKPNDISSAVYGSGLMAKTNYLRGVIDSELLKRLIKKLITSLSEIPQNRNTKVDINISRSVYSIGLMAKEKKLSGPIPAELIVQLLKILISTGKLDPQHINNPFFGIGYLAKEGYLDGQIDAEVINYFFEELLESTNLTSQDTGNTVIGAGFLAKENRICGSLNSELVILIVQRMMKFSDFNALRVCNILYALAFMSTLMDGMIDAELINSLLKELNNFKNLIPQDLGISVYSVGIMAKEGKLDGFIDAKLITQLLIKLSLLPNLDIQAISNFILGGGLITKEGRLEGTLEIKSIEPILTKLMELCFFSPIALNQALSNTLNGLGYFAKEDRLLESIDAKSITFFLEILITGNSLEISIAILAIGKIAKKNKLKGMLNAESIVPLLKKVVTCPHLDAKAIGNIFCGLGMMIHANKLLQKDKINNLSELIHCLKNVPSIALDARQSLFGVLAFWPEYQCSIQNLEFLFKLSLQTNFLHPSIAANLISEIIVLKEHHVRLDPIFNELLTHINLPLTVFSANIQKKLKQDIDALQGFPSWKEALEKNLGIESKKESLSPNVVKKRDHDGIKPNDSTSQRLNKTMIKPQIRARNRENVGVLTKDFPIATQNRVFQIINTKNLEALKQLLKVKSTQVNNRVEGYDRSDTLAVRKNLLSNQPVGDHNKRAILVDKKDEANILAKEFFEGVEAGALRQLIEVSDAIFFVILLQACSQQTLYQLAISNNLYLLIRYLSFEQLKIIIVEMYGILGFYRHHLALMRLIDALNFRMIERPSEREELIPLRSEFLQKGVNCHKYHVHVTRRLNEFIYRCQFFILLEEEVEGGIAFHNDYQMEVSSNTVESARRADLRDEIDSMKPSQRSPAYGSKIQVVQSPAFQVRKSQKPLWQAFALSELAQQLAKTNETFEETALTEDCFFEAIAKGLNNASGHTSISKKDVRSKISKYLKNHPRESRIKYKGLIDIYESTYQTLCDQIDKCVEDFTDGKGKPIRGHQAMLQVVADLFKVEISVGTSQMIQIALRETLKGQPYEHFKNIKAWDFEGLPLVEVCTLMELPDSRPVFQPQGVTVQAILKLANISRGPWSYWVPIVS